MIADSDIAAARARTDVYAAHVKLRRSGVWWIGKCPLHSDRSPSFAVRDGRWKCFAGCGGGDTIDFVRRLRGLDFAGAVRELSDSSTTKKAPQNITQKITRPIAEDHADEVAAIVRQSTAELEGTHAAIYLWSRGLPIRQPGLLAHPSLYCHEIKRPLPALVAPLTASDGTISAVQRIWIAPSMVYGAGNAPKDARAPLQTRKKTLGHMMDGSVRLGSTGTCMGLAEGVESACAARRLFKMPVWAVCGASRLGSVWIPPITRELIIFGDNGEAGHRLAEAGAALHRSRGVRVEVVYPDARFDDFNTQLIGEGLS